MTLRPPTRCRRGPVALGVCCLLLVACSGAPVSEPTSQPTIADLHARSAESDAPLTGDARDQAIASYLDYLRYYPASEEKTRVLRRVADLLLERAADARAVVPSSPQIAAAAQEDYATAIDLYQQLLEVDPGRQDDAALRYQLARAYEESGQTVRATAALEQLVRLVQVDDAPRLYADAQFRRGELLFAERSFLAAEQAYRAVLGLGETVPVYRQARYKLAWTLYKLARYDEALALFFAVVDNSVPLDAALGPYLEGLSRAEQEQLNDVFRGISLCFSHLGGAASVDAYFQRHGDRGYLARVYRDLAALYTSKEFFSDAAETYLALARRDPLHPESARLYVEVIELYRRAGLSQQVLRAQAALVRDYGMNLSFRARYPLQALPELSRELQSSLVELARHDHARAAESGAADDYRGAEQWYQTYLQLFPDGNEAPQMKLGLAGLYYDNGQYVKAALGYEEFAYSGAEHQAAARAGRLALDAHQHHLTGLEQAQREHWSARSTASAVRFVESFPGHADAPAVFSSTGVELLERGQAEQAIGFSEQVLQRAGPASPLRPLAWTLLAQSRYQLADYEPAEQAYRQALASIESTDHPQYPVLRKGLAASLYKQAERSRAGGDAEGAAALFQRAADASQDPTIRGQSLYDAAAELLALERWQQAARALEQFRTDYPTHALQQEVARKLAFAYEQGGRETAAAAEYRRLGTGSAAEDLRREALVRAADLYRRAGGIESAIGVLERYVNDFPRPPEPLIDVYQRLAELYRTSGDEAGRRRWLRLVVAAYEAAGKAADQHSRTLAAEASLALAEQQAAAFRRIELVEPLQTRLRAKLQALQSAIEAFEQASDYNVPTVSSAANYRIAVMYNELGVALLASERPAGLNAQELEQYNRLLAEQAEPFRNKTIEIHESNLRRIAAGYYDAWIEKSLRRLAELWPARYAKEERSESFVQSLR